MAYIDLITSQHADKPKFVSTVDATLQPAVDNLAGLSTFGLLFDLDIAVGQQLDIIGQWIGIPRTLTTPLVGVYFELDGLPNVGFDYGVWKGIYDPASGLVSLPDDYYRLLLKMDSLNNHWNGTKEQAYSITETILKPLGLALVIEDKSDLSINLGIFGYKPAGSSIVPSMLGTPLLDALLKNGILEIKPVGVRIANYFTQAHNVQVFAFDITNSFFGGFDNSDWAEVTVN